MPSQYYWSAAGSLYFVATVATIAFVAWVDRKVRSCCSSKVGSETTNFHIFVQALIWNGGSRGRVRYQRFEIFTLVSTGISSL